MIALFSSVNLPDVRSKLSSSMISCADDVDAGQYVVLAVDKLVSPSSEAQTPMKLF
jgi:hypothetical protein